MRKIVLDNMLDVNWGWLDAIEQLQDFEKGELLDKIIDYLVYENKPDLKDFNTNASFIWPSLKMFIDECLINAEQLEEDKKELTSQVVKAILEKGGGAECPTES